MKKQNLIKMKLIVVIIFTTFLFGCSSYVETRVTTFNKMPRNTEIKTYAFVPLKNQEYNLEYETYKNYIREKLAIYNFKEVPRYKISDVLVTFDYSIIEKTELRNHNVYGQTGTSTTTTYGTLNTYNNTSTYSGTTYSTPTYGVVGTSTSTEYVYVRRLKLNIYKFDNDNTPLYQGEVISDGSASQLNIVMKYLVEALFKNFPGENGKTKQITIPMKEK